MNKQECMIAWVLILAPTMGVVTLPVPAQAAPTTEPPMHCCECRTETLVCQGTEAAINLTDRACTDVNSEEECPADCVIQPDTGAARVCFFMENARCQLFRRGIGSPFEGEFEVFGKCVPGRARVE